MPVTQFWNHFGVTNRENPLFWCANAYAPTGVHTGTYTHKIRLTITVSSQLQYEKCIARRGIDIYLYSNLYININCVYMIWLRWFMIRHIPDARASSFSLSVARTFLLILFTAVVETFFLRLSFIIVLRHPMILMMSSRNFRLFYLLSISEITHVRFKSLSSP